jgi:hypothetical protein
MQYALKTITFNTIKPIWEQNLWSGRNSKVKTHSSMTWPFDSDVEYNMEIYKYPATYWALLVDNVIIGVNSGHKTSDNQYRSRGLWIEEEFRGKKMGQFLLNVASSQALVERCNMIWSIPRKSALKTYHQAGFIGQGDIFATETSDANIYASKLIIIG